MTASDLSSLGRFGAARGDLHPDRGRSPGQDGPPGENRTTPGRRTPHLATGICRVVSLLRSTPLNFVEGEGEKPEEVTGDEQNETLQSRSRPRSRKHFGIGTLS